MATSSPDSEIGSIECFQNYTSPEVFVQGLAGQINQQDVEAIIRAQKQMLQRFEKTNEMLSNCNSLSASRFTNAQKEFKKHTALLHEMKKELDTIFKRIRIIKSKLETQYPQASLEAKRDVLKEESEGGSSLAESVKEVSNTGNSEDNNASSAAAKDEPATEKKLDVSSIQLPTKSDSPSDTNSSSLNISSSSSFEN